MMIIISLHVYVTTKIAESVRTALFDTASLYNIKFQTILKPIIVEAELMTAESSKKVFEIDYSKRCGALEVQVAFKTPADNRLISHILFSKIFHGCWPVLKEVQALFEYLLDSYRFQRIIPDDHHHSGSKIDLIKQLREKRLKSSQRRNM